MVDKAEFLREKGSQNNVEVAAPAGARIEMSLPSDWTCGEQAAPKQPRSASAPPSVGSDESA